MKKHPRFRFMLIAVFLFSFLTGCGQSDLSDSTLLQDGCLHPEDIGAGYELIFVCPITENPYWISCADGMHRADAELGTHTTVIGPKNADNFATEIVGYIAEAVQRHPDGIIAYASIPAMAPYIEQAAAMGIPVITVDADATTDKRIAYVGTDLYSLGYKAGSAI